MADWKTVRTRSQPTYPQKDEDNEWSNTSTFKHAFNCVPPVYKKAAKRFVKELKEQWDARCKEESPNPHFRMDQAVAKDWMQKFVPIWLKERLEEARGLSISIYEKSKALRAELYRAEVEAHEAARLVIDAKYNYDVSEAERVHLDRLDELD